MPDGRAIPPLTGDERAMLEGWLEFHRGTLLLKCSGLDDAQVRLAAVEPSVLTLLRWWRQPGRRPRRAWLPLLLRLALPVGFHMLIALVFLVALPALLHVGATARLFVALDPDIGYVMVGGGGLALGWSIIHLVVALALLRRQGPGVRVTSPLPA